MFKEGKIFIPDTLGLEIICKLPKSWILDCRSKSKIVQLQMIHEFNSNGYIYTQRELKSGKNYKMIMKKAYKISIYHNKKAALESIYEAENITEKDIEQQIMNLTQEEETKSKQALGFYGDGHGPHNISTKAEGQILKFGCNSIGPHNLNSEMARLSKLHIYGILITISILTILHGIGLGIIVYLIQRLRSKFFIRRYSSRSTRQN